MLKHKQQLTDASFFAKYAHEYDQLTNARARTEPHRVEVQSLINDFDPSLVLDAGCGSGLTSMLLASEGVKTVGMDREAAMIKTAKKKYDHLGYPLKFIKGSFENPPKSLTRKFDLLICLANGISGLGSMALLKKGMRGFYSCLKPGGSLVIQMLNFTSVAENKIMPIRATKSAGIIYARYARRQGRRFSLHIVRIDNSGKEPAFEAFCHDFDNFTPAELARAVKAAGFSAIKRFADVARQHKFAGTARDLVLVARKPNG